MEKKRPPLTTILLIVALIFLLGAVIFISRIVLQTRQTTQIAPKKTKATSVTYSKLITLNRTAETEEQPENEQNEREKLPADSEPTETVNSQSTTVSMEEPTPTEKLLAYNNLTSTPTPTPTPTSKIVSPTPTTELAVETGGELSPTEKSPTVTVISNLPEAGLIDNIVTIFTAASLLILLSFFF